MNRIQTCGALRAGAAQPPKRHCHPSLMFVAKKEG
jgi:hypothetical protein